MNITVFAKKATSKEGKNYSIYLGRLINKITGEEINVRLKFREDCGQPKADSCPMNIIVAKDDANLVEKAYTVDAETRISRTLWISKWEQGEAYVDHSLDDYD